MTCKLCQGNHLSHRLLIRNRFNLCWTKVKHHGADPSGWCHALGLGIWAAMAGAFGEQWDPAAGTGLARPPAQARGCPRGPRPQPRKLGQEGFPLSTSPQEGEDSAGKAASPDLPGAQSAPHRVERLLSSQCSAIKSHPHTVATEASLLAPLFSQESSSPIFQTGSSPLPRGVSASPSLMPPHLRPPELTWPAGLLQKSERLTASPMTLCAV